MRPQPADARFGAGAALHRASRWSGLISTTALFSCLGLALWLGTISDVDVTSGAGSGWGARAAHVLLWNIPSVALGRRHASHLAITLARAYSVIAVAGVVAAAAAGLCWLRADRLRKPIAHETPPRHLAT